MGISERKQREKEQVKKKILQSAWEIILKEGVNSLSLRNIAEAIEYSTPVIYSHFSSKEAILHEFYKQGFVEMNEKLKAIFDKHSNPESGLYAVAIGYWDFAFENKHYYQLMFGVNVQCCEQIEILPEKKQLINFFHEIVESVLLQNKNKIADPALKRSTFWCILHGLVSINITSKILKEEGKTEKVLDDAVKAFIASLKA